MLFYACHMIKSLPISGKGPDSDNFILKDMEQDLNLFIFLSINKSWIDASIRMHDSTAKLCELQKESLALYSM